MRPAIGSVGRGRSGARTSLRTVGTELRSGICHYINRDRFLIRPSPATVADFAGEGDGAGCVQKARCDRRLRRGQAASRDAVRTDGRSSGTRRPRDCKRHFGFGLYIDAPV